MAGEAPWLITDSPSETSGLSEVAEVVGEILWLFAKVTPNCSAISE